MERGREVLVGKLAIGRRLIERADAIRCFNDSNGEPFWELAVREGLLGRADADDLVQTVDGGSLICRGTCKGIFALDPARPPADDRCPTCKGPVYVMSKHAAATRDTWKDAGEEVRGATGVDRRATPPPRRPTEVRDSRPADLRDAAVTIAPNLGAPGPGAATPGPPKPAPPRPTPVAVNADPFPPRPLPESAKHDSLPSAIPIKPKKTSVAVPVHVEEPAPPPRPAADSSGFTPFTIGAFEVLAPIGKGGMGSVFRVRHKTLNRIEAIKIFTSHVATDDEQVKRFDREVKTMAKLDHPGIVRIKGGGVVSEKGPYERKPYYVMEYVAGRDLATWAREKPRSPGACAAMIVKVCEIVDFFHARSIIHRDLKPQNVIVSLEGDVPKICDFGLAKVEDSKLTRTGDIMGTPQFMPPEQALGAHKDVFTPTDVYSLGAILYFLLAGEPPFDLVRTITGKRGTLVDLIDRIVREPAPRVRDKNPAVPATLEAIVLKCFEKKPPNRFHNARDLGTALKGLNLPL